VAARRGLGHLAAGDLQQARLDLTRGVLPFGAGGARCAHYVVLWAGASDQFALPADSALPASDQFRRVASIAMESGFRRFDEAGEDRFLTASIPLPNTRLCSGQVEVGLRRTSAGANNDEIKIGVAPFDGGLARSLSSNLWADAPDLKVRTVTHQLTAELLAAAQQAYANQTLATLDFLIGDDSDVDYIKLTLFY
jgi:hypothetical protein